MTRNEWRLCYQLSRMTGPIWRLRIDPNKALAYAAMAWVSNKKKTGEWK